MSFHHILSDLVSDFGKGPKEGLKKTIFGLIFWTCQIFAAHLEVEQDQGIPYGIYDFPWSRSENPDHVTGNIRVLSSEALILDNISNKVQVQMPWSCFWNVSGSKVGARQEVGTLYVRCSTLQERRL